MNQLAFPDTRSLKAERADELLDNALGWIKANPDAWRFIVASARVDADRYKRVRIKSYIESLRYRAVTADNAAIKLPNAYSAPFGRILAAWHPELVGYIPLNASKLDGCVIPPRFVS